VAGSVMIAGSVIFVCISDPADQSEFSKVCRPGFLELCSRVEEYLLCKVLTTKHVTYASR
jgi:hypothetical protein